MHDSTVRHQFVSRAGRQIDSLIHRFHKPAPTYDEVIVLNFYVLNGTVTADENDFSGPLSRRPNIERNPARYVAQVQINARYEDSILATARDMTDLILNFLPDEDGRFQADKLFDEVGGSVE